jgi:hypothetical protein
MRRVLGFTIAVVAVAAPSIAFAQSTQPQQPGTPVYREWMPQPTPIGGDPPATTPATPGTSGTSGTGTSGNGQNGSREAGSGQSGSGSSTSTTTVKVGEGGAAAGAEGGDKPGEGETFEKEKEGKTKIFADVMFGFGVEPVVNQTIVGPYVTSESRERGAARFVTQSFLVGGSYEVSHGLRIGAMLPMGTGSFYPGDQRRGGAVIGNLVLGGEYEKELGRNLDGYLGLDVALPTASGDELLTQEELNRGFHVNQQQLDKFALNKAMSDSRGREDTAAFTAKHLGVVPKLGAVWRAGARLEIEPYVKYESLFGTGSNSEYEGAIVVAARGTYRITKQFDGTVRVWTNIPVAGDDKAVAVAEPQLRYRMKGFTPLVGVVLPFVGTQLTDPYVIGVRAAIAGNF